MKIASGKEQEKITTYPLVYLPTVLVFVFFILHQLFFILQIETGGLAIFSNLIPMIYLVGLPYLIIGIIKKSKVAFTAGFLLTLIFFVQGVSINLFVKNSDAPQIKVMTHNLQVNASDKSIVETLIRTHQPDIILLQEVSAEYYENELQQFAHENEYYLAEKLSYNLAVLSKTPLTIIPSQPSLDAGMGYLLMQTTTHGKEILLANIHNPVPWFDKRTIPIIGLPFWWYTDNFRSQRITEILTDLEQYQNSTIIFGGDFNMNAYTVDYRRLNAYQDTFKAGGSGLGFTWPKTTSTILNIPLKMPLYRLDYIFTTQDVEVVGAQKLSPTGSDHLPLMTTLSLPPN